MDFLKVAFQCTSCGNKADIFFEEGEGINEVFEKTECIICKEIKLIGVGDLGYRFDMPNPDYPPWQAQFIQINHKEAVCPSCADLKCITLDHSYLVTDCFICKKTNTMKVIKMTKAINESLSALMKTLSYKI